MVTVGEKQYEHFYDVPLKVEGTEAVRVFGESGIVLRAWVSTCPDGMKDYYHVIYDVRDTAAGRNVFITEDVSIGDADLPGGHYTLLRAKATVKNLLNAIPPEEGFDNDLIVRNLYKYFLEVEKANSEDDDVLEKLLSQLEDMRASDEPSDNYRAGGRLQ